MAWITKNSAETQIERRAEPYLTADMRKDLSERIVPRYANKQAAVLPCLHTIQHAYGWVPAQAMIEIAEFLGLKPSDIIDTASFYEEYWLKPKGEHLVQVCRSIACEFCGQKDITAEIELIRMDEINHAFERMEKADVKYRFVIDMRTL